MVSIKNVHKTAQPKKKIFTMAEVLHILLTHKKREDNLMTPKLVSVLKSATKNPKFVATLYIFLHKKTRLCNHNNVTQL